MTYKTASDLTKMMLEYLVSNDFTMSEMRGAVKSGYRANRAIAGSAILQKEVKTNEVKADIGNKVSNFNNIINQVEYIQNHPGRYNGLIADPRVALKVSLSPQQSYDYASAVTQLKDQAFLNQVNQLRGLGALSDAEGKKIQSSLANLSINQSKEAFDRNLKVIFDTMNAGKQRAVSLGKPYGLKESDFGIVSNNQTPQPASTGFKEGAKTKSKSGKPMVFRNVAFTIEDNPFLKDQVRQIRLANGQESITLKNGARYEIAAATRDAPRGKTADFLYQINLRLGD